MFNLIKMEVYRLMHMPSLYVLLVLLIVIVHFAVDGTSTDIKEEMASQKSEVFQYQAGLEDVTGESEIGQDTRNSDSNMESSTVDNDSDNVDLGISIAWDSSWINGVSLPELLDYIYSSGLLMLLVAIFIPLFVAGEQKSGYIKNIIGQLPYRGQLAWSKLVPVIMEIVMAFAVFDIFVILFSKIYMEKYFTMGSIGDFLAVSGYHLLTHVAFGILLTFVVLLLRGKSGAMVFGIMLSMDLFYTIYTKVDKWLDVKVSDYMLSTNMHTLVLNSGSKIVRQGVVVSVLFLTVSMALAVLTLQKRDIR